MCEPTASPIGVIAISAPSVKKPIPRISKTAPITKAMSVPFGIGVIVKQSSRTIPVTGMTDNRDSLIFSFRIVLFFLNCSYLDIFRFCIIK